MNSDHNENTSISTPKRRKNGRKSDTVSELLDVEETKKPLGERRRLIDPTTCEREYTDEEVAFMNAMDLYKRLNGRQFPTWSEVLEVVHALGYRRVAEPTPLPGEPGNQVPKKG
ncbi:MAG: hypothetical protein ACK4RK_07005 [Gemmataceae bacterium]